MSNVVVVQQFQHTIQHILDMLFPPHCAMCKRSGQILCTSCISAIPPLASPVCQLCGSPKVSFCICLACQNRPLKMSGLRALSTYQEPLRSCIHALKYNGNTRLAEPLGSLLAQVYVRYQMQADMLIPVPLHKERQQQRGYNQAQLLAKACARLLCLPVYDTVLTRIRATSAQVGLTATERRQNVQDAFLCTPPFTTGVLHKRTIIVIDDVSTTGATLEACAAPLFAAGAQAVWGLVLARPQ